MGEKERERTDSERERERDWRYAPNVNENYYGKLQSLMPNLITQCCVKVKLKLTKNKQL